ncbi:MAG: FG-GAP repeat protein [Alphaproteobacteria bacterium]|nr:FG-GAP repeat protein [Alphaproteobacteria bacterium]
MRHLLPLLFLLTVLVGCLMSQEEYHDLLEVSMDHDQDGHRRPPYENGDDCDDEDATVFPGAEELCDNQDNDCDFDVDEGVQIILYADVDGDGFGDPDAPRGVCGPGEGLVENAEDCDDANPDVWPGAVEVCGDGLDNDCSGDNAGCRWSGEQSASDAVAQWRGIEVMDAAGGVTALGDTNGDGLDDVLVAAPYVDRGASWSVGEVYLLLGPATGTHSLSEADAIIEGVGTNSHFGQYPAGVGDLNSDGYADIGVGLYTFDYAEPGDGAALIFFGPLSGSLDMHDADVWLYGAGVSWLAGTGVVGLGDTDGDGHDDVAIRGEDGHGENRIYVVNGPLTRDTSLGSANAVVHPRSDAELFASFLREAGDFNGDGLGDLVTNANLDDGVTSEVYVHNGPLSGALAAEDADVIVRGPARTGTSWFEGSYPVGVGDHNNDGYDDLATSSPATTIIAVGGGVGYLFYGPLEGSLTVARAEASIMGEEENTGAAIWEGLGDLDGDGSSEVVCIGIVEPTPSTQERVNGIFFGPTYGTLVLSDANAAFIDDADLEAGIEAAGDLNGDGFDDLGWSGDPDSRGLVRFFFGMGG